MHNLLSTTLTLALVATTPASARTDTLLLGASQDNTLFAENGEFSNGAGVGIFSGVTNAGTVRRALVQFDLSALPAGSVVHAVELRLRITQTIAPAQAMVVHRVLEIWGEGASGGVGAGGSGAAAEACDATWTRRFTAGGTCSDVHWATPGADHALAPSAIASAGNLGTLVVWTGPGLVADVQAIVDGFAANHGWLLRHVDELTGATAKRFGAREASALQDRPALVVEYTPPPPTSTFCAPGQASSVSPAGSAVSLIGSRSLASNDNQLVVATVPDFVGLFVQADAVGSPVMAPFGGTVCLAGAIGRFPTQVAQGGTALRSLDFQGTGIEAVVLAGETWYYQWVHRDVTPGGGNLSAGLAVTWAP